MMSGPPVLRKLTAASAHFFMFAMIVDRSPDDSPAYTQSKASAMFPGCRRVVTMPPPTLVCETSQFLTVVRSEALPYIRYLAATVSIPSQFGSPPLRLLQAEYAGSDALAWNSATVRPVPTVAELCLTKALGCRVEICDGTAPYELTVQRVAVMIRHRIDLGTGLIGEVPRSRPPLSFPGWTLNRI